MGAQLLIYNKYTFWKKIFSKGKFYVRLQPRNTGIPDSKQVLCKIQKRKYTHTRCHIYNKLNYPSWDRHMFVGSKHRFAQR